MGHAFEGHNPDYTWRDPAKAGQMAWDTFEYLRFIILPPPISSVSEAITFVSPWNMNRARISSFINYVPLLYTHYYLGGATAVDNVHVSGLQAKIAILNPAFALDLDERDAFTPGRDGQSGSVQNAFESTVRWANQTLDNFNIFRW